MLSLAKYIFQPFVQDIARLIPRKLCIKLERWESNLPLFPRIANGSRYVLSRFFYIFSLFASLCLYFMIYISMALMTLMMSTLATLIFLRIFPISRFFLRWRWTWRIWRQGMIPLSLNRCIYSFSMYIFLLWFLLFDPYLNWNLWLNEKNLIHYLYTLHICSILAEHVATRLTEAWWFWIRTYIHTYIHSYIHTYIYIRTYTFIYIYVHTYKFIHMSKCITKEGKKEICNKYVNVFFLFKKILLQPIIYFQYIL